MEDSHPRLQPISDQGLYPEIGASLLAHARNCDDRVTHELLRLLLEATSQQQARIAALEKRLREIENRHSFEDRPGL